MTRVHYDREPTDYLGGSPVWHWFSSFDERPRLLASATALALGEPATVLDPACGDGSVISAAYRLLPSIREAWLADLNPAVLGELLPSEWPFTVNRLVGDVFDTLTYVGSIDAIVLTEILEHLGDPDALLRAAHDQARWLVASSPIVPTGVVDSTEQHLWSFDMDGYYEMLIAAGWKPRVWYSAGSATHPIYPAGFQIWGCER